MQRLDTSTLGPVSTLHPAPLTIADKIEALAKTIETCTDDNIGHAMDKRMCCDGNHCGCQGATIGEYLAYQLRETLR